MEIFKLITPVVLVVVVVVFITNVIIGLCDDYDDDED